jgi:hypothetical protein
MCRSPSWPWAAGPSSPIARYPMPQPLGRRSSSRARCRPAITLFAESAWSRTVAQRFSGAERPSGAAAHRGNALARPPSSSPSTAASRHAGNRRHYTAPDQRDRFSYSTSYAIALYSIAAGRGRKGKPWLTETGDRRPLASRQDRLGSLARRDGLAPKTSVTPNQISHRQHGRRGPRRRGAFYMAGQTVGWTPCRVPACSSAPPLLLPGPAALQPARRHGRRRSRQGLARRRRSGTSSRTASPIS